MASEAEAENEVVAVPPAAAAKQGGSTKLLIIASALVMILTPLITIFVIRTLNPPREPASERPETVEIMLPKVQVNVAETNATRYAQIEVVVELSDNTLSVFFQNQGEDNPQGQLRRIMATIIAITSSKDLNSLITTEAKEALAEEIREALNRQLREAEAKGMVTDVYFCGFLIQ